MNFKNYLIIGFLLTIVITSCKKDEISSIEIDEIELDSTKLDNKSDSKIYNIDEYLNKIKSRKEETTKSKSKRFKRINKFKNFIKSKLKKSK